MGITVTHRYDDIIELPHHQSRSHPHMPIGNRAAQFLPFAALTGYEEALQETARRTDERVQLDPDEQEQVNAALQSVLSNDSGAKRVAITYFVPDKRKSGGSYQQATGVIRHCDAERGELVLQEGDRIPIADILRVTVLDEQDS
ncbi:hypothetical protein [Bifidobacterium tsurumiense]|uniref:YolD-like protein n=1 Tax=Bifidobacterium tsurumiense TaxID=356829 RepID=A0A087EKT0_9BIFI|nr:hypothetical protein [Bifidobacterium tsurumiense]KFJ08381.1 hypothetical protein BITS_0897 [Bifidobacterium tsurumiense]